MISLPQDRETEKALAQFRLQCGVYDCSLAKMEKKGTLAALERDALKAISTRRVSASQRQKNRTLLRIIADFRKRQHAS